MLRELDSGFVRALYLKMAEMLVVSPDGLSERDGRPLNDVEVDASASIGNSSCYGLRVIAKLLEDGHNVDAVFAVLTDALFLWMALNNSSSAMGGDRIDLETEAAAGIAALMVNGMNEATELVVTLVDTHGGGMAFQILDAARWWLVTLCSVRGVRVTFKGGFVIGRTDAQLDMVA